MPSNSQSVRRMQLIWQPQSKPTKCVGVETESSESLQASSSKTTNPDEIKEFSSSPIHSLHLQILEIVSPYTTEYIWQHEPLTLTVSNPSETPPHFHGKPSTKHHSIQVWDTGGEFLLIEAAFYPPNWLNPETNKRSRLNTHPVKVGVPVSVARVLKCEPCMISLAVGIFYDRDVDSMNYAAKFQQTFQAPKCYPMPSRNDASVYVEAELGMKIACGFEMMYQQRRHENLDGKGTTFWIKRTSSTHGKCSRVL
ncbi:hypothetical protein C5167_013759 [Papaver somniferum]|uniref:Uncharacterized protein n=1 Tax=Papaver somniferum TaxID=3469 RepID=A0A4Y7J5A9_PAPSO|nr:hypothetical protein C5167_013759 [Papaver somniferum]